MIKSVSGWKRSWLRRVGLWKKKKSCEVKEGEVEEEVGEVEEVEEVGEVGGGGRG